MPSEATQSIQTLEDYLVCMGMEKQKQLIKTHGTDYPVELLWYAISKAIYGYGHCTRCRKEIHYTKLFQDPDAQFCESCEIDTIKQN